MEPKPIKHIALWDIKRKNDHKATMEYSSGFNIVARKIKEKVKKTKREDGESLVVFPVEFCLLCNKTCLSVALDHSAVTRSKAKG